MDKLEEYIRKNREELDKNIPSPDLWNGIRKDLHRRRLNQIKWLSAAAMIVIIFSTASLFYVGENRRNNILRSRDINAFMIKANPQLVETEVYYNNLVNSLYNEASPLLTRHPDLKNELFNDFSQIDSICTDIKKDLKDNVDNQEVIEALINNYRIKIQILEDMLVVLKQDENNPQKSNSHEL
jgi:hypothetical protein